MIRGVLDSGLEDWVRAWGRGNQKASRTTWPTFSKALGLMRAGSGQLGKHCA